MKICDTFDISTLLEPTLKVTLNAFLLYSDCVRYTEHISLVLGLCTKNLYQRPIIHRTRTTVESPYIASCK